jgi:hypothetical protein
MGPVTRLLLPTALVAALLACAAVPAIALGCPIPIRTIGPIDAARSDLQQPLQRTTTRQAWGMADVDVSVQPQLSQFVRLRRGGRWHGVTFPRQRVLSLDARAPFDNMWTYEQVDRPDAAVCMMVGKRAWLPPKVHIRQGRSEVRVLATSRRTPGDSNGCELVPPEGERPCPTLTRIAVRLKRPMGTRRLVFEQYT